MTHSLTAIAFRASLRGEHELATRAYEYAALQRLNTSLHSASAAHSLPPNTGAGRDSAGPGVVS